MRSLALVSRGRRSLLAETPLPLDLDRQVPDRQVPGDGPWEVEIGFGKGRFLLASAAAEPGVRFLGIEMAARYFNLVARRMERRGLDNVLLIEGEALYALSAALPRAFARAVHVYFPDPWPKERHHKRRLFDCDSIDLVLELLAPGGTLYVATDHLEYGAQVREVIGSHPALSVELVSAWPDGARTNYELKYEAEGRPILRLAARLNRGETGLVHPEGVRGLTVGARREAGGSNE